MTPAPREAATGALILPAATAVVSDGPSGGARRAWWAGMLSPSEALHLHACLALDCFLCDALWSQVCAGHTETT